ncbi:MAG: hypothetical protein DRQ55_08310 [Planctomycetota bacterium]|nr:MAG: hypothetical protein DRQ55_08310 [Planctomycetota bacterium]
MTYQDAHTHLFSRTFFDTLAGLSPLPGEPEELIGQLAARTGMEIPPDDTEALVRRWLEQMDRADVSRMVTFASLPPEAKVVSEAARLSGGRLLPYTLVDPSSEQALAFASTAFSELGMRGLLLFPAMHHVEACDPRCDPLYELAAAHDAPVIVHCGILKVNLRDLLGLPRPYDLRCANPLAVVPAANRHPDVTFVLPHFGGGFFREALMAGVQCENITLDTSSSNDWIRTNPSPLRLSEVFRRSLDAVGSERILFGTDSCTFPRGYRVDVRDNQLAAARAAGATDDQIKAMFGGNLARMLPASD